MKRRVGKTAPCALRCLPQSSTRLVVTYAFSVLLDFGRSGLKQASGIIRTLGMPQFGPWSGKVYVGAMDGKGTARLQHPSHVQLPQRAGTSSALAWHGREQNALETFAAAFAKRRPTGPHFGHPALSKHSVTFRRLVELGTNLVPETGTQILRPAYKNSRLNMAGSANTWRQAADVKLRLDLSNTSTFRGAWGVKRTTIC